MKKRHGQHLSRLALLVGAALFTGAAGALLGLQVGDLLLQGLNLRVQLTDGAGQLGLGGLQGLQVFRQSLEGADPRQGGLHRLMGAAAGIAALRQQGLGQGVGGGVAAARQHEAGHEAVQLLLAAGVLGLAGLELSVGVIQMPLAGAVLRQAVVVLVPAVLHLLLVFLVFRQAVLILRQAVQVLLVAVGVLGLAVGQLRQGVGQFLLAVGQFLLRVGDLPAEGIQSVVVFRPAVVQLGPGVGELLLRVGELLLRLGLGVVQFRLGVVQLLRGLVHQALPAQLRPLLAQRLQRVHHAVHQIVIFL